MELRVLRYFLAAAQEEGISRAAEVLHVTQPTLSRQLAQLEEEVGVRLFHRGARKITLTEEGMLLRRRAEEILALVDRTREELTEQETLVEGSIVIGSGEYAAVQLLAELIVSFRRRYPLVRFELVTATADQVREQLERGLADIGLLSEPIDIQRFGFIRLARRDRWVVMMRPDDPLTRRESVRAADFAGKSVILPGRRGVRNELESWFGTAFAKLSTVLTSDLSTNAAVMVHAGLGYSFVLEGSMPFLDREQIVCRPLSPELEASCVLAWKKNQAASLAVRKWIEHVQCSLSIDNA